LSAFQVLPYSDDNLVRSVFRASRAEDIEAVGKKRHLDFFREYFATQRARTIVVEPDYIDKDYLEDHAAWYDRCFEEYDRHTWRLHFFDTAFSSRRFKQILLDPSLKNGHASLAAAYLGFIVVKPLPRRIIGRTCLKTYPDDDGRRQYPAVRKYRVNLYGLDLTVRSLAYQEQDKVVGACATIAIWSCLQGTGRLFQHEMPAPVEITKCASDHLPDQEPSSIGQFPELGMTLPQMVYAVRSAHLAPSAVGVQDRYQTNSLIYAYLKSKIPLILAAGFYEFEGDTLKRFKGGHAVTLAGFSLGEPRPLGQGRAGFLLRASRIDEVYAHDDQVGPFARMPWATEKFRYDPPLRKLEKLDKDSVPNDCLKTFWRDELAASPWFVLLPLYQKIRIPFRVIHHAILKLDLCLEIKRKARPDIERAEWDIYLTTANDYKTSIRRDYEEAGIDLLPSLIADLPRFVWRAMARVGDRLQLDLLFDSTGIEDENLLVHVAAADCDYRDMIASLMWTPACQLLPLQARAVVESISFRL